MFRGKTSLMLCLGENELDVVLRGKTSLMLCLGERRA